MATLADITRAAIGPTWSGTDSTTPEGHFLMVANVVGITTTYLLAGEVGDSGAQIVGRIENLPGVLNVVRGNGIKGGTPIVAYSSEEAFARMIRP
jgi:hypothetical protein